MPRLTKEQFEKWSSQAKNGFQFDWQHYVNWNEKELVKHCRISEDYVVSFTLLYQDETKKVTNDFGCTFNVSTGKHLPSIQVQVWKEEKGSPFMHSYGIGDWYVVGDPQAKKNYKELCKLSGTIDINQYMPSI